MCPTGAQIHRGITGTRVVLGEMFPNGVFLHAFLVYGLVFTYNGPIWDRSKHRERQPRKQKYLANNLARGGGGMP